MDVRPEHASPPAPAAPGVPGILLLVGGASAAIGSFLDWFGAGSAGIAALSVSGTETRAGTASLACGLAVAAVGASLLLGVVRRTSPAVVAAAAAGALIVVLALASAATARDRVLDAATAREAARVGGDRDRAAAIVRRALGSAQLSVAIEGGLFLVFGGGLLAAGGAVLAAASGGRLERRVPGDAA